MGIGHRLDGDRRGFLSQQIASHMVSVPGVLEQGEVRRSLWGPGDADRRRLGSEGVGLISTAWTHPRGLTLGEARGGSSSRPRWRFLKRRRSSTTSSLQGGAAQRGHRPDRTVLHFNLPSSRLLSVPAVGGSGRCVRRRSQLGSLALPARAFRGEAPLVDHVRYPEGDCQRRISRSGAPPRWPHPYSHLPHGGLRPASGCVHPRLLHLLHMAQDLGKVLQAPATGHKDLHGRSHDGEGRPDIHRLVHPPPDPPGASDR